MPATHTMYRGIIIPCILFCLLTGAVQILNAQEVKGTVKDSEGNALPYASVFTKQGGAGTVANAEGDYNLRLAAGTHTIICAYVGFQKIERTVTLKQGETQVLAFVLQPQQSELRGVEVKANAEDPAYAIMRNAIAKRSAYLNEVYAWKALVYMKGLIRTTQLPKQVLGVKIDANRDVVDSSGKGIIYFSESLTNYYRMLPDKRKEEVISARLSGNSSGFGFNSPADLEVNLYESNISISGLNSRGFVSPLHSNSFYFYRFKYAGTYFEDGAEVHKIEVFPRRTYEPLFAGGYIEIMEGSWRIHGVNLHLSKTSQIEIVDSLHIRQQMFPVRGSWMPQSTSIYASFGLFGVKANANFIAVYSNYDFNDSVRLVFADKVIKKVDTAANKRSLAYWSTIRPMPLTEEEVKDYDKKDSLERKLNSPAYLDSLDRRSNKLTLAKLFLRGQSHVNRYEKKIFSLPGLLTGIQYNTVEGWNYELIPTFRTWRDTASWLVRARIRYAFGTGHFNASGLYRFTVGEHFNKRYTITLRGGKNVYQINPLEPIMPFNNTSRTLIFTRNDMKIYEKWFGGAQVSHTLRSGLRWTAGLSYEDRIPLFNTDTSYTWRRVEGRSFTPNYPQELPEGFFERHKALLFHAGVRWQPGGRYIQYPTRTFVTQSKWPILELDVTAATPMLNTKADFSRWKFGLSDDINMKLAGAFKYLAEVGGFMRRRYVQLPDWQHFVGNLTIRANPYVSSFQLAPYYANSTIASFFTNAHAEWHLNGFLSNKIPVFRRLNWFFVTGANAFYVDTNRYYGEIFGGIENIFKIIRVDYVVGYDKLTNTNRSNIVIGISGLITGRGTD